MRKTILAVMISMTVVLPSQAVEFLGVELCTDRVSTAVALPHGSPLTLDSVEVGDQGALLLVLRSEDQQILNQIDDDWVDVMGVVVNNTVEGYNLATFDLSLWDAAGHLICVDTISVSVLKGGQHRAFRDSIQCPGYSASSIARTELHFAGGH